MQETNTLSNFVAGMPDALDSVIQKSLPLLSLWRSDLTLSEYKILDTYLARINTHDANCRCVRFEKRELERLIGVTEIRSDTLKQRLKNLCTGVELEDRTLPGGFVTIYLFDKVHGGLDKNGQWQIDLQCSESARKYIFNIENAEYVRYRLREIVHLKSRYSYILFLYLEQNRFRGTWDISLDSLKHILKCDQVELYDSYFRFNEKVLKRAQQELKEKNGYVFSYGPIRTGRKVTRVQFTVPPKLQT